jgi:hypothetical protein
MPRLLGPKKVRLNLELSESVRDRLEQLRIETDADTLVEVVRRALAVYSTLVTSTYDGTRVFVRSKNGKETLLLLS